MTWLFLLLFLIILICIIYSLSKKLDLKENDKTFQNNVTKTLIIYTIFIITSTAGITKFIFLDYVEKLEKCEKNDKELEKNYKERDLNFYKNKATMLQAELNQYIEILSKTNGTKKYYEAKILSLENKLNKKEIIKPKQKIEISSKNIEQNDKNIKKYIRKETIKYNNSLHDKISNFTIGVISVYPDSIKALVTANKKENDSFFHAGKIWYTKQNNKEYEILLKKIDFINDECEIVITEL